MATSPSAGDDARGRARSRELRCRHFRRFAQTNPGTGAETFAAQTAIVHAWRRFPFIDPDLPDDLLPRDWPRKAAYELFRGHHERWAAAAQSYFDELTP